METCADQMTDSFQAHKDMMRFSTQARAVRFTIVTRLYCAVCAVFLGNILASFMQVAKHSIVENVESMLSEANVENHRMARNQIHGEPPNTSMVDGIRRSTKKHRPGTGSSRPQRESRLQRRERRRRQCGETAQMVSVAPTMTP